MSEIKKRSIPLRRIVSGIERISLTMWYEKWAFSDDYSFILESGQKGRYSYIGKAADELIKGKNEVNTLQRGLSSSQEKGDPFIFIEKWLNARDTQNAFSEDYWTGGACGYLSYDLVRWIECLPEKAIDDLELPDYLFILVKDLIVVDHELHQVILIAWYGDCVFF